MRKYIKLRILELMQSIREGLEEINNVPISEAVEILTEVQNSVLSIGNTIEETEEENKDKVIPVLEQFAEKIYYLAEDLLRGEVSKEKICEVRKDSINVKKIIEEEIFVVYEVVFAPYKASMWDCMESVYYAAVQYENCHVVVMPIPYYNLSEYGEVLDQIYEGTEFPQGIKIVNYEEYDIAKMCPDVIFIHNPYDEYNYVTRVPVQYYSRELVKYTNHLVYLPYKVCKGKVKDIYCALPGVKYAWRTFVQSEGVRDTYIKYNASDKIVALGSPKVDKIIDCERHKPEIPNEWKSVLNGRKVFLLNTHLNNIINHAEEMIDKLKSIFSLFRVQHDIAIVWRPHPLSIQTAKSMNPGILIKYMEIINEFKSLENGVYDDSSDMNRAVALADAYIGDWSSLVSLFGITGKPILLTEMMNRKMDLIERNQESIRMSAARLADGKVYFCMRDSKGLYTYDLESEETEYIGRLNYDLHCVIGMVNHIFKYHDKLLLAGGNTQERYVIYCLDNGKNHDICSEQCVRPVEEIKDCFQYKERVYIISSKLSSFGYIDMVLEKYVDLSSEIQEKVRKIGLTDEYFQIRDSILNEEDLYFLCQGNKVIKYSMESNHAEIISIDCEIGGLLKLAYNEQKLYFIDDAMKIYQYSEEDGEYQTIKSYSDNGIRKIIAYKEKVWLVPLKGRNIYYVNFKENGVHSIKLSEETVFDRDLFPLFGNFKDFDFNEDELLLYPRASNRLMKIRISENLIEEKEIKKPENMPEKMFRSYMLDRAGGAERFQSIYYERVCKIEKYIDLVKKENDIKQKNRLGEFSEMFVNAEGNCGVKIWEYIINRI